jgi:hypothetical protein
MSMGAGSQPPGEAPGQLDAQSTADALPPLSQPSTGAARTPGSISGAPGTVPPGSGGAPGAAVPPAPPAEWLTYTDKTFGFSISYPDTYVILETANPRETPPRDLVHQVRFQDKALATGQTADLEIPKFRIEVFDNAAGVTLDRWLDDHQVAGTRTEIPVGGQQGIQVSGNTMLAPNQFHYTAHGAYVYRLTPLGPYAMQMLDSFKLSG